jgi:hypothetical protein
MRCGHRPGPLNPALPSKNPHTLLTPCPMASPLVTNTVTLSLCCCPCRPPDADPDGAKLAATADPLGEATKYVVALVQVRIWYLNRDV